MRLRKILFALAVLGTPWAAPPATARASELTEPLSVEECWKRLPPALSGAGQPLPNWARLTAGPLPRTTAAMLHLDLVQRTAGALGPALRGEMRWVAADANRCEYARTTAEADLRRANVPADRIAAIQAGPDRWPAEDREALEFAREMTLDAGAVTDARVESLRKAYGEERLVAMVLLLAYANFQDRLLLTLAVPLEEGGPLPPVAVRFDAAPPAIPAPARARPQERRGGDVPALVDDPEWIEVAFDVLQTNLTAQRANGGRIRVPSYEQYLQKLPADAPKPKAEVRIRWSLVCMGYKPELAAAWSACTRTFGDEAAQDRVFEESLFWVVTRTIHCFY